MEIRDHFLVKVCEKRMSSMGMMLSPWAVVLIAAMCRNPAEVVILCFVLKLHSVIIHQNHLGCSSVVHSLPHGFISEEGLEWLWKLQKLKVKQGQIIDNLLDCVAMRPAVQDAA
jgi:hypothetical protein